MPPAKRRRENGSDEQPDLKELIETNISNATQEIKTMVNNQEKKILEKVENSSKTILERIGKLETQVKTESDSNKSLDKKFVLNETFCDVLTMKEGDYRNGKAHEHFGRKWRIVVMLQDSNLGVYLAIKKKEDIEEWSADAFNSLELSVGRVKRETIRQEGKLGGKNMYGTRKFCTWQEMQERWLVDGKLSVKVEVHIKKMAGSFKPKLIDFDATAKFSDYILEVGGEKFHILKQLLAMRSSYFEAFFYGNFTESTKSKTALQNVDPTDFQNFLEVLHGEYKAIDDFTLEGIMLLNDVYDAKTVEERCQEYLMEKSQLSLVKKLKLVSKYRNEELKEKLISEIKTLEEYKSIVADGVDDFSPDVLKALLKKSLTLQ
ncbi:hypothetical protein B9Z55_003417 [Caenorhabditis nigoni]|uniref:BTB domain-containing protein n=1 Tax=Caenorhabditis nigoni TaxID=1611254 RepID=A0A2G5VQI8_9PELO|nr:hypothetical protein B9Z55_003417 [Caenorhabditis nigoni]